MRKFLLLILLIFNIHSIFSQNKTIDSLKIELKKNPKNYNLQIAIINELLNVEEPILLKREINLAKNKYKNNKDLFTYFTISEVNILIKEGKIVEATQKLDYYRKKLKLDHLPQSQILFNYLEGNTEHKLGNNLEAGKYFLKCFKIIEENQLNSENYENIYNKYASSLIELAKYNDALSVLFGILKFKKHSNLGSVYTNIGICYFHLKQFNKAEYYYKLAVDNSKKFEIVNNTSNLAILYLDNNEVEKADKVMKYLDHRKFTSSDSAAAYNVLGEIEKLKKNFSKAIKYFKIVEKIDMRNQQNVFLLNDYLAIGILYIENKDYEKAEEYLTKCYNLSNKCQDNNAKMEVLEQLLKVSFLKNKNYKDWKYYNEYVDISDSINSHEVQKSTNELNTKYQTLVKDSQLKTQQLEISKEKTNRNLAFGGIGLILLLSGSGFWFFKNKQKQNELKNQNTLLSLQQNLNAMELQSLNKQLDPHEIKNLLGSISPEIQEKAPEAYRKMLKLFNITKASLNNSSITDSVENQVRQVEDLLSLEKSMLTEPLEYFVENKITNQELQIPRLMLKNLVENSIKHGIKGKENGGKIQVILEEIGNFIRIKVDDTGKGRKHAISLDSGIGTSTYQNLFATLNKRNKESASFEIIDKEQGTKVEVKIPKDYQYS